MECRNVRQCAAVRNPGGDADVCGSSHMLAMSEAFGERCTNRTLPLPPPFPLLSPSRQSIAHQISFFCWGTLGSACCSSPCPCVAHHFLTGHARHRGSRGTQIVAPSSIIA